MSKFYNASQGCNTSRVVEHQKQWMTSIEEMVNDLHNRLLRTEAMMVEIQQAVKRLDHQVQHLESPDYDN
jgi:hypothetical protein